jgi:hypothetical protein
MGQASPFTGRGAIDYRRKLLIDASIGAVLVID